MVDELGFLGALVNPTDAPSGGRRYLDDPACGPLLAAAEALGRPLFVHPSRDLPAGEHYDDFVMSLIVGRPTQTAVCAARLIFTGTLDRHPRLSLLLAHGGGVLPAMAGRLDATWRAYRPDRWQGPDVLLVAPVHAICAASTSTPTCGRSPRCASCSTCSAPTRLLVGNDQPPVWFPLGESLALLDQLALPAAERDAIRWGNATRLFGIAAPGPPPGHERAAATGGRSLRGPRRSARRPRGGARRLPRRGDRGRGERLGPGPLLPGKDRSRRCWRATARCIRPARGDVS